MRNRNKKGQFTSEIIKSREERFWDKVSKKEKDDCWNWLGAEAGNGYGKFYWGKEDGKRIAINSHKASWLIHFGELPEHDSYHGMCVLHRCDNGMCVNPNHLWLGTNKENAYDMIKKGRLYVRRGEELGLNKLTKEDVLKIRKSNNSHKEIAKKFGIGVDYVSRLINKKYWKHI